MHFCHSSCKKCSNKASTTELWWYSWTNERYRYVYSSVWKYVERFSAKEKHFTNHS